MNHPVRSLGRALLVGAAAAMVATVAFAAPAWAHVTVHPASLPAGSSDIELTFRVPNERDDANTVGLQVFFPKDLPLLTVDVRPVPGWTAKVDTQSLATPITTDDGPVTQIVSDITWTATAGGIAPGQYEDFDVAAGQVPDHAGALVFKSLQTYSSGEVVRWIQVASSGNPDPDTPAPVLTLTPAAGAAGTSAAATGAPSSTQGVAIAALVVAVVGLAGVVALFVRGRRRGAGDFGSGDGADPAATPPA